jgi:hypothetical protein
MKILNNLLIIFIRIQLYLSYFLYTTSWVLIREIFHVTIIYNIQPSHMHIYYIC